MKDISLTPFSDMESSYCKSNISLNAMHDNIFSKPYSELKEGVSNLFIFGNPMFSSILYFFDICYDRTHSSVVLDKKKTLSNIK